MPVTINAQATTGLLTTADGSGIVKLQSNGKTTNALAWMNFVGSSVTVNSSYNISSITRGSSGLYAPSFTTALSNASYSPVASTCSLSSNYLYGFMTPFSNYSGYTAPSTSSFSIINVWSNGGASWTGGDSLIATIAVFGQ